MSAIDVSYDDLPQLRLASSSLKLAVEHVKSLPDGYQSDIVDALLYSLPALRGKNSCAFALQLILDYIDSDVRWFDGRDGEDE